MLRNERLHSRRKDKTKLNELCLFQRHAHVLNIAIFSLKNSYTHWDTCEWVELFILCFFSFVKFLYVNAAWVFK